MTRSVETPRAAGSPEALAALIAAWLELKSHLERRCRELNDEVRSYPTPIARCDEQLTELIERRARAVEHLKRVIDSDPGRSRNRDSDWRAGLESYLSASGGPAGNEEDLAVRQRLEEAFRKVGR